MELVDLAAPPVTEVVAQESASAAFVDSIILAESSGNPNARPCDPETGKPRSSAFGAGQFIAATWLEMVRKYRPDLADKSDNALLALRGDFEVSRQMTVFYAEQNRNYLSSKGLKPTRAALYLAHFAGPTGAAKLLSADPEEPVEDILSEGAIKANPFLEGKTAAGVHAWAKKKMKANASAKPVVTASAAVTPYSKIPDCSAANSPVRLAALSDAAQEKPAKSEAASAKARENSASSLRQGVRLVGGVVKKVTGG